MEKSRSEGTLVKVGHFLVPQHLVKLVKMLLGWYTSGKTTEVCGGTVHTYETKRWLGHILVAGGSVTIYGISVEMKGVTWTDVLLGLVNKPQVSALVEEEFRKCEAARQAAMETSLSVSKGGRERSPDPKGIHSE
jgi:hypothetical protein